MNVTLTAVGITDRAGLVCKGTDPVGREVRFRVTEAEMGQLAAVLYGDLAANFTGVTVDAADILTEGA